MKFFTIIFLVLGLVACAGKGGGGGGGNSSGGGYSVTVFSGNHFNGDILPTLNVTKSEADIYRVAEYNRQWGLEAIHAAEAYAALENIGKNVAGNGVKIAIVDTGVVTNHFDIADNLNILYSYNYYKNSYNIDDLNGHGSNVASIAAGVKNDNIGTQGVAYDAKLVIADTYCCVVGGNAYLGNTNNAIINVANNAALSGVRVINASFGSDEPLDVYDLNAGTAVKNKNVLLVVAAGNDAKNNVSNPASLAANSQFNGFVLAVGAVDSNSNLASFSNKCGDAAEHCLVAPGVRILGAYIAPDQTDDSYYVYVSGTSQATPHVTGAAAVLFGAWPFLTAPQVSNILLTTATDLGVAGVDSVYGWGMLNLYKAVQAQGSNGLSYGASVGEASYDIRTASIISDPIFGDALTHNVAAALQNAVFFDDYGRDYKANLGAKISARATNSPINNLRGVLLNNYKTNVVPLTFSSRNSFHKTLASDNSVVQAKVQFRSYSNSRSKHLVMDKSQEDKSLTSGNGFSFVQESSRHSRLGFAFNVDELRNNNFAELNNFGFLSVNGFAANPFQSFVGGVSNLQTTQIQNNIAQKNFNQFFLSQQLFSQKLKMTLSYQTSYEGLSLLAKSRSKDNQISDVNFAYTPHEKTTISFSLGNLNEFNNNFLNSQALGAFETGGNVKTSYFKISASQKLFNSLSFITSFSEGITQAKGNDIGIFRSYNNIRSRASSLGFVDDKIFGGRLGIIYSEPLRLYKGKVTIDVPIARDDAGNVTRFTNNISLKPQGKERNFEVFYSQNLSENSRLGFNFLTTKDVGNIKKVGRDYLGLISYNLGF